ncbi:MAG TPA: restriction endonuclease subunit S [Bacillota bacterium]|nr:restriction endonuclease subunit S [Bacillota bacterium]
MNLKPYPEYKESGVPWLGKVPGHWEVRKFRTILYPKAERNQPNLPLLSVVREKGVIKRNVGDNDENHNVVPEDLSNCKVVRTGQFAMNKMKAWQGSYGISKFTGIVSPAYFVFDLNNVESDFFHMAVRSKAYVPFFTQASDGVRVGQWDLSQTRMKEIQFWIPSLQEQQKIVKFLDFKTQQISCFIRAKKKIIELLKEQKQIIINQAVTRGLDPNVKLKPCGVEWLGEIPEHWEVLALKRVLDNMVDCEHKTAPSVAESQYQVLRTTAVRDGSLKMEGTYYTTEEAYHEWTKRCVPRAGDIVFTREAPVGEACILPEGINACLGQRTVLLRTKGELYNPEFLLYMLYGGPPKHIVQLTSKGSTVGHFNVQDIGNLILFKPPIQEQLEILKHIKTETKCLNLIIFRTEREIALMQEYRTRLIADVVTGKVDVRDIEVPDVTEGELSMDYPENLETIEEETAEASEEEE